MEKLAYKNHSHKWF